MVQNKAARLFMAHGVHLRIDLLFTTLHWAYAEHSIIVYHYAVKTIDAKSGLE